MLATLVLASCSDEPDQAATGAAAAPTKVLEGSISDAMIQYDELRSQPPLAPLLPGEREGEGEGGAGAATAGDNATGSGAAVDASPAPQERSATPEPAGT